MCIFFGLFFFFSSRRRHTRSYGDWSSDVCSSDLGVENVVAGRSARAAEAAHACVTYVTPAGEIAAANGMPLKGTDSTPSAGWPSPAGGVPVAGAVHNFGPAWRSVPTPDVRSTPLHASPHAARRGSVAARTETVHLTEVGMHGSRKREFHQR